MYRGLYIGKYLPPPPMARGGKNIIKTTHAPTKKGERKGKEKEKKSDKMTEKRTMFHKLGKKCRQ
jgi:hypothetical protein